MKDTQGMELAIENAKRGMLCSLRPFGSVVVDAHSQVLGQAAGSETPINPTRHSEVLAIQKACRVAGGLLEGCTLYQTLEPCMGCCGFINHSKISRVVIGSMREDFPTLFRERTLSVCHLLGDTSKPAEITVFPLDHPLRQKCIALFDIELNIELPEIA